MAFLWFGRHSGLAWLAEGLNSLLLHEIEGAKRALALLPSASLSPPSY